MWAAPLSANRVEDALRAVRALGSHRYVAGRLHVAHAFALAAIRDAAGSVLAEPCGWARAILDDPRVDAGSRDEALYRRISDAELLAVLDTYWAVGDSARGARDRLRALVAQHELDVPPGIPFDEAREDDMHPLLVDAGWELLPLSELKPDAHRGAIAAFGTAVAFSAACHEEEAALAPRAALMELPALGALELLGFADDEGTLTQPLVVWVDGNETYLDYVMRGVRRAARLPEAEG
jgi:hypothetical protein